MHSLSALDNMAAPVVAPKPVKKASSGGMYSWFSSAPKAPSNSKALTSIVNGVLDAGTNDTTTVNPSTSGSAFTPKVEWEIAAMEPIRKLCKTASTTEQKLDIINNAGHSRIRGGYGLPRHTVALLKLCYGLELDEYEEASLSKQNHQDMLFIVATLGETYDAINNCKIAIGHQTDLNCRNEDLYRICQGMIEASKAYAKNAVPPTGTIPTKDHIDCADAAKRLRLNAAELALTIDTAEGDGLRLQKNAMTLIFSRLTDEGERNEFIEKGSPSPTHDNPWTKLAREKIVSQQPVRMQEQQQNLRNSATKATAYQILGIAQTVDLTAAYQAVTAQLVNETPAQALTAFTTANLETRQKKIQQMYAQDPTGKSFLDSLPKTDESATISQEKLAFIQMLTEEGQKTTAPVAALTSPNKTIAHDPTRWGVLNAKTAYDPNAAVPAAGARTQLEQSEYDLMRTALEEAETILTPSERTFCLMLAAKISKQLTPEHAKKRIANLNSADRATQQRHIKDICSTIPNGQQLFIESLPSDNQEKFRLVQLLTREGAKSSLGALGNPQKKTPYDLVRWAYLNGRPGGRSPDEEIEFNDMRTAVEEDQTTLTVDERKHCLQLAVKIADTIPQMPEQELMVWLAELESSGKTELQQTAVSIYRSYLKKQGRVCSPTSPKISHLNLTDQQKLALRNLGYRAWGDSALGTTGGNVAAWVDRNVGVFNLGVGLLVADLGYAYYTTGDITQSYTGYLVGSIWTGIFGAGGGSGGGGAGSNPGGGGAGSNPGGGGAGSE